MFQFLSFLGFCVLALFSRTSEAQNGSPCHADIFPFTSRHSLNLTTFMGDWYTHEIAGSHIGNFPEPDYKCYRQTLSHPDVDDLGNIDATESFLNKTSGIMRQIRSQISVNETRSPYSSLWNSTTEEGETAKIVILFTDLEFKEWAVMYSCSHIGPDDYRYEVLMGMTRSRAINPDTRKMLKALMVGQGFRIGDHHPVDQVGC